MEGEDADAYIGPVTATLPLSEQFVPRSYGQWCAFAEPRDRETRSGALLRVWLGVVQARDADEIYLCPHAHRLGSAGEACAAREAKRRASEEMRHKEAEWRERLGSISPSRSSRCQSVGRWMKPVVWDTW